MSFVNGAAGTGKTSIVVACAIRQCLARGEKVILTATDNEMVDRALLSVLPMLTPDKVSLPQIVRLGVPTAELKQKYPNICLRDEYGTQRKIDIDDLLTKARLVAVTVDTYIGMLAGNKSSTPAHIFMDEAAHCSLAKALLLFSSGAKITLAGDSMQLPPVCTITKKEIQKDRKLCLWALSALYFDDLLSANSIDEVSDIYLKGKLPTYRHIKQVKLNYTYRYGNPLASILAKHSYGKDFSGSKDAQFRIIVINAPSEEGTQKRTSSSEVKAINDYIKENRVKNYVVLSPYRNQVRLLKKSNRINSNRVTTVHKAQGREWVTVILSVVDTQDAFFTDSTNKESRGLQVLTTAISRAKNELVLVCDVDYWINQPNQLIADMIQAANVVQS